MTSAEELFYGGVHYRLTDSKLQRFVKRGPLHGRRCVFVESDDYGRRSYLFAVALAKRGGGCCGDGVIPAGMPYVRVAFAFYVNGRPKGSEFSVCLRCAAERGLLGVRDACEVQREREAAEAERNAARRMSRAESAERWKRLRVPDCFEHRFELRRSPRWKCGFQGYVAESYVGPRGGTCERRWSVPDALRLGYLEECDVSLSRVDA